MFHLIDYTQSVAAPVTDADIPLATDASVTSLNSHAIFPNPVKILGAYALGLLVSRCRISTPRLRPIARPLIRPIEQAATPSSRPQMCEYFRAPIQLNPVEEIQLLITSTTAVAEREHVALWVGDGNLMVPPGDLYTARFTTTFTPTANAWSAGQIVLDDTPMAGRYSIVGLSVFSVGLVLARLFFPGTPIAGAPPQIRPGTIGDAANGTQGTRWFRWGLFGEFGQFESFAQPSLEVMNTAATANPEGFLDIVPVRIGALGRS